MGAVGTETGLWLVGLEVEVEWGRWCPLPRVVGADMGCGNKASLEVMGDGGPRMEGVADMGRKQLGGEGRGSRGVGVSELMANGKLSVVGRVE